jgi:hypothetical protein
MLPGSGTILCGLASSMEMLIAARAIAGMGGGGCVNIKRQRRRAYPSQHDDGLETDKFTTLRLNTHMNFFSRQHNCDRLDSAVSYY